MAAVVLMTITTMMMVIVNVLIEEDEDLEGKSSLFILDALFLNKMFSSVFNHIVSRTAVYMSLGIPPQLDELPPPSSTHPPTDPTLEACRIENMKEKTLASHQTK